MRQFVGHAVLLFGEGGSASSAASTWWRMTSATTKVNHFCGELGVEFGVDGERAQPGELLLLARGVGCRHPVLRLQLADLLRRLNRSARR